MELSNRKKGDADASVEGLKAETEKIIMSHARCDLWYGMLPPPLLGSWGASSSSHDISLYNMIMIVNFNTYGGFCLYKVRNFFSLFKIYFSFSTFKHKPSTIFFQI